MAAKAVAVTTGPHDILTPRSNIRKFSSIPEEIDAIQFRDWQSATDIFTFGEGFMYVPQGYEHRLRRPEEFDHSNGALFNGASEFLVFKTEQGEYRVDLGFWVLKKATGDVLVYHDDQFKQLYTENMY